MTNEEVEQLINKIDENNNGSIDFEEFMNLMESQLSKNEV